MQNMKQMEFNNIKKLSGNYYWSNFNRAHEIDSKLGQIKIKKKTVLEYRITSENKFRVNIEIGLYSCKNQIRILKEVIEKIFHSYDNCRVISTYLIGEDLWGRFILRRCGFEKVVTRKNACKINDKYYDINIWVYRKQVIV